MLLTRYPAGSFRELLTISLPLMLSSFSVMLMLFVDRLFLAHYSAEALGATASAATTGWALIFGPFSLAAIAEVFVAQYNGGDKTALLGKPVWQMLWVAFASLFFFVPLAIWGTPLLWGKNTHLEQTYFFWMILFGPVQVTYAAVAGFFIGQGKLILITALALIANLVNAFFDAAFIFGIPGLIPEMGVQGAAIATSLGSVFQTTILLFVFLNSKNQKLYGTLNWCLDIPLIKECLRIGIPGALSASLELAGWAVFYRMMTYVGPDYLTAAAIGQSLILLLLFFPEGLMKAVMTISGNLIGARQEEKIQKLVKKAILFNVLFFGLILGSYPFWYAPFLTYFMSNVTLAQHELLIPVFQTTLLISTAYLLIDGIRFIFAGVLTAAGDTFYLFLSTLLSMWFLMVFPTYFLVVMGGASVLIALTIHLFYTLALTSILFIRFRFGDWEKLKL